MHEERYMFCCGDNCEHVRPAAPKERVCSVEGNNYIVGLAYENVKLNGESVTYVAYPSFCIM